MIKFFAERKLKETTQFHRTLAKQTLHIFLVLQLQDIIHYIRKVSYIRMSQI